MLSGSRHPGPRQADAPRAASFVGITGAPSISRPSPPGSPAGCPLRSAKRDEARCAITPSGIPSDAPWVCAALTPSGAPWVCAALGALSPGDARRGVEGEGRGALHRFRCPEEGRGRSAIPAGIPCGMPPSGCALTPSGAPWVCAALGALSPGDTRRGVEGEGRGALSPGDTRRGVEGEARRSAIPIGSASCRPPSGSQPSVRKICWSVCRAQPP